MELVASSVEQLLSRVGDLWGLALIGSFLVMICEAAKPKPAEGEAHREPMGFALLAMILSFVTPLLLFFHAVLSGAGSVIGAIVLLGGAVILSGPIGWGLRAATRDGAHTLNRAAPVLAIPVFALTLYVTGPTLFAFVNGAIGGAAG